MFLQNKRHKKGIKIYKGKFFEKKVRKIFSFSKKVLPLHCQFKKKQMEPFNIKKILQHYGLKVEEIAPILFPNVKYPKKAFERALKENAPLNTRQLSNLAAYIGISTHDLLFTDAWKGLSEEGHLVLVKGDYTAKINYNGSFVSIFNKNELIYQLVNNSSDLTIGQFIKFLNNIIKEYENGTN